MSSFSSSSSSSLHKSFSKQQQPQNPVENPLEKSAKKKKRPGRPLLSFAQLAARKAARASSRRTGRNWNRLPPDVSSPSLLPQLKTPHRPNGSSVLENLPVELLERIFLYALNPNFCRASPFLAAAVSSDRIYRTLIRLAFFKDAENDDAVQNSGTENHGRANKNKVSKAPAHQVTVARRQIAEALKPADYHSMRLDEEDRIQLQTTILKCNWCTKQRIEAQLPALMRLAIWRYWVLEGFTVNNVQQQEMLDALLDGRKRVSLGSSIQIDGTDQDGSLTYSLSIEPLVAIYINNSDLSRQIRHRVMDVHVIPDYLLRGRQADYNSSDPWTEDDIDLLETLRLEYGFDQKLSGHDMIFSRDALHSGILTAIASRNAQALSSLLKIHEFFGRRRLEKDPPPGCPNRSFGAFYSLPEEFFLEAIRLAMPEAMQPLMVLLRCSAESIPPDSSELTDWALELSSDRSVSSNQTANLARGLGAFVLDMMADLPRPDDELQLPAVDRLLFIHGRFNTNSRFGNLIANHKYGLELAEWCQNPEGAADHVSYDVRRLWPATEV